MFCVSVADGLYVKADVDDPNWWLWLSENDIDREPKEVQDGLGSDGYVIVTQEEIVDSISRFIARYISSVPQAKVSCTISRHVLSLNIDSSQGFWGM